jgi:WD40 repeat protein
VWNTSTGGELWTVQPGDEAGDSDDGRDMWATCSFCQDGSLLAGSLDGKRLQVWDVATRDLVGEYWLPGYAKALAWSTDGRRMAVGDSGGYIHLLQLEA